MAVFTPMPREDARQLVENLADFFTIRAEWSLAEMPLGAAGVLTLIASLGRQDAYIWYIPPRGGHKAERVRVGEPLTQAVLDYANSCRDAP